MLKRDVKNQLTNL